jgi:Flp pilus assembly protein TadD
MHFEIGYEAFDVDVLPEAARDPHSAGFRDAVTEHFEREFADLGGDLRVEFGEDRISVTWMPTTPVDDLFAQGMQRLEAGDLPGALPYMQAFAAVEPTNTTAHYNLGMALSDLGDLEKAQWHLLKVVRADPSNVNALVALGVALYRAGDAQAARRRLEQAVKQDPDNGYAQRNLAAVLMSMNETDAGIAHFRDAYRLLPDDQQSVFGLASALDQFGTAEHQAEADRLYTTTIDLQPNSPIAEMARTARSQIAQKHMRGAGGGAPRMDAVMYCIGALDKFDAMTPEEVRSVAIEIATLGQQGLDVNSPEAKYTLRSLPGDFTGLQLMSYMYAAFQQLAPDHDIGFDLAQEYEMAQQMRGMKRNRG